MDAGQSVDQLWEAPIKARHGHVLEETGHTDVEGRVIEACSLMSEGAGQPGFAGARLAGKDDLLLGLDPSALSQRDNLTAIEVSAELDIRETTGEP